MSKELQNRLYNYEVNPPSAAWEKIVAALDESHLSEQFPKTLYELEVAPPATAWDKIKGSLAEAEAKPAPVRSILSPLLKYAAAAAVIAAVALGSMKLLQTNSADEPVTEERLPHVTEETAGTVASDTPVTREEHTPQSQQDAADDAALEASKKTYASLDATEKQRIKNASETYYSLYMADPISTADDINPHNTYRDLLCTDVDSPSFAFNDDNSPIDMATRYVTLMTPNGHFVRISKKLAPLVCCVAGEEQDEDCNNQLKKWREKLARPDVGTSPGNFLELLNLIHTFKENNP